MGIPDEDIWNMDETEFRIGCGGCHWVVSTHQKELRLVDPNNPDYKEKELASLNAEKKNLERSIQ